MDFAFTQRQKAFRAQFDALCQERIAVHAATVDRTGHIPEEVWRAVAESGYLRLFHPEELGGLGADGVTLGIAMECLARACGSTFWCASVSTLLCGKILAKSGRPEHQARWLRPILRGEKIGAFAVIERSPGSELGRPTTTIRRAGRGYLLSGEKVRVSNTGIADIAVVRALDLERAGPAPGAGDVYVVVDLRQKGVTTEPFEKMGLRGMPWGRMKFDDIEVSEGDVIAMGDRQLVLQAAEWGQLFMSFCSIAFAQTALDKTVEFASSRVAFGAPLAHLPVVHGRVAEMKAEIDAARLFAMQLASTMGAGKNGGPLVMMSKVHLTEMAVRIIDLAMRTHGSLGYLSECGLERLYRDSLGNIAAGSPTDRLRDLVACSMVDESPWTYDPFEWPVFEGAPLSEGA